jgi:hypothetical protein
VPVLVQEVGTIPFVPFSNPGLLIVTFVDVTTDGVAVPFHVRFVVLKAFENTKYAVPLKVPHKLSKDAPVLFVEQSLPAFGSRN